MRLSSLGSVSFSPSNFFHKSVFKNFSFPRWRRRFGLISSLCIVHNHHFHLARRRRRLFHHFLMSSLLPSSSSSVHSLYSSFFSLACFCWSAKPFLKSCFSSCHWTSAHWTRHNGRLSCSPKTAITTYHLIPPHTINTTTTPTLNTKSTWWKKRKVTQTGNKTRIRVSIQQY